ncbi:hypothetical protein ACFQ07_32750, partial [Actinomadura adrarensis]
MALTSIVLTAAAGDARTDWAATRGWGLTSIAAIGAVPALAVMYGIWHAAHSESAVGEHGKQVAELVALRQLLQRVLPAVGSLVALSTLALGAAVAAQRGLPGRPVPAGAPQSVLIFGGVGSVLVALVRQSEIVILSSTVETGSVMEPAGAGL